MMEISEIVKEVQEDYPIERLSEDYLIEGLSEDYQVKKNEDENSLTLHCLKTDEELDTYWKNGDTDKTILNDAEEHAARNQEDDSE